MGVSTDALLFYGYVWDDEHDLLGDLDGPRDSDWAEHMLIKRGQLSPWREGYYPHSEQDDHKRAMWRAQHRAEFEAWAEAKKAVQAEFGVEVDHHGSDEWKCPLVAIAGTMTRVGRGYPDQILPEQLAVDPAWNDRLQRWVTELGIDLSEAQGPGWFMASWWG